MGDRGGNQTEIAAQNASGNDTLRGSSLFSLDFRQLRGIVNQRSERENVRNVTNSTTSVYSDRAEQTAMVYISAMRNR